MNHKKHVLYYENHYCHTSFFNVSLFLECGFFIVSIYRCQQLIAGSVYKILFSGLLTLIIIQMCVKRWHNMYNLHLAI